MELMSSAIRWNHFMNLLEPSIPKVEVNLDPLDMGSSYSRLIVTMGLSTTVRPKYTPQQTDGHASNNSSSYTLICISRLKTFSDLKIATKML